MVFNDSDIRLSCYDYKVEEILIKCFFRTNIVIHFSKFVFNYMCKPDFVCLITDKTMYTCF